MVWIPVHGRGQLPSAVIAFIRGLLNGEKIANLKGDRIGENPATICLALVFCPVGGLLFVAHSGLAVCRAEH